jgi:lipopolysaccharide export system protein LptC
VLLPGLAVLIAVVFTAYSYLLTPGDISIDILGSSYSNGKLTMANPKLDGFTKENRPYSMRAARAIQDVTNTSVFQLDDIQAKLPLSDGNWANVVTAKGIYDKDKNTLNVPTEMTVTTTDGMVAKLNSAFVDIASGDLKTSDPVDITLQGSHITADSMTVGDRGKVLVFDEKVRLTMMPQKKKPTKPVDGASHEAH